MGGKVLVPAQEFVPKLSAARLAADILGVPTILVARTDALGANLIRGLEDPVDAHNATGTTTAGRLPRDPRRDRLRESRRGAPTRRTPIFIWCETGKPDVGEARAFAQGIHEKFPASSWPTTARRRSTGSAISMRSRWRHSRTRLPVSATASSSSRSPAFTPSTPACSTWRSTIAGRGCWPTRGFRSRSSSWSAAKGTPR